MKDQIRQRLDQLKAELVSGEQQLRSLETRKAELERTLARIQGAIQVLQEMLAEQEKDEGSSVTGKPAV